MDSLNILLYCSLNTDTDVMLMSKAVNTEPELLPCDCINVKLMKILIFMFWVLKAIIAVIHVYVQAAVWIYIITTGLRITMEWICSVIWS